MSTSAFRPLGPSRRFALAVVAVAVLVLLAGWFTGLREVMHAVFLALAVAAFLPLAIIGLGVLAMGFVLLLAALTCGDGPAGEGVELVLLGAQLGPPYYRWLGRQRHPVFGIPSRAAARRSPPLGSDRAAHPSGRGARPCTSWPRRASRSSGSGARPGGTVTERAGAPRPGSGRRGPMCSTDSTGRSTTGSLAAEPFGSYVSRVARLRWPAQTGEPVRRNSTRGRGGWTKASSCCDASIEARRWSGSGR